ncbi:unnamed protein product [Symbiodinium sp. KB8]|nr:unnamed protein product [Symbiodinium sp. KB8]
MAASIALAAAAEGASGDPSSECAGLRFQAVQTLGLGISLDSAGPALLGNGALLLLLLTPLRGCELLCHFKHRDKMAGARGRSALLQRRRQVESELEPEQLEQLAMVSKAPFSLPVPTRHCAEADPQEPQVAEAQFQRTLLRVPSETPNARALVETAAVAGSFDSSEDPDTDAVSDESEQQYTLCEWKPKIVQTAFYPPAQTT